MRFLNKYWLHVYHVGAIFMFFYAVNVSFDMLKVTYLSVF